MDAHIFALDAWGDPVGAGVSGARHCTLEGVAKSNTPDARYTVANEFLCGRVAALIGLPTPPGVIARTDDGDLAYVSLRFGDKGEMPPPVVPADVVADNPSAAAGVVAFDCWILNGDRHAGNLAYVHGSIPLTVFDHSHALFGPNEGSARLESYDGTALISGCLHAELASGGELGDWCDRIAAVDERILRDLFLQMAQVGAVTADEAQKGSDFLIKRKNELLPLISADPTLFPKIKQWGLTP